tara:strand:+ start:38 stop:400 length:363 start_codon:yes stop_codon:yes gene_type:complete
MDFFNSFELKQSVFKKYLGENQEFRANMSCAVDTSSSMNVSESLLLHNIIQATEEDPNLSMLPTEFKDAAIEIMFQEALSKKENTTITTTTEIDLTNKRPRCDLIDHPQSDMDCEGADAE